MYRFQIFCFSSRSKAGQESSRNHSPSISIPQKVLSFPLHIAAPDYILIIDPCCIREINLPGRSDYTEKKSNAELA
jgi:hypothetical protein